MSQAAAKEGPCVGRRYFFFLSSRRAIASPIPAMMKQMNSNADGGIPPPWSTASA